MGKARLYGMQSVYVPNAKADERRKKKFYEKGKAFADKDEERGRLRRHKRIATECKKLKEQATQ